MDIVERLCSVQFLSDPAEYDRCVQDAAIEIERLRSRVAELEARLEIDRRLQGRGWRNAALEIDAKVERLRSALAEEREACAKVAEEVSAWCRSFGAEETAERIAATIRSRT